MRGRLRDERGCGRVQRGGWRTQTRQKKVTRRDVPPDIKAVKLLMEGDAGALSDEEIEEEMKNLEKMLKEENFD